MRDGTVLGLTVALVAASPVVVEVASLQAAVVGNDARPFDKACLLVVGVAGSCSLRSVARSPSGLAISLRNEASEGTETAWVLAPRVVLVAAARPPGLASS